ncbi:hypothetical protein FDENT_996 [Fusarium denticulatum]|uniref:Uncharacterized protein n=1 Tax=Fusarium denticulatum TaxID=48507 RepID=A0A8H5XJI8_9HYPO|nr:hypothetical protein FDENT_996 [Fusarium denticulatum]
MECKHVDAVRKRFSDSIHPRSPLPPKYNKAIGALGLLLISKVTYRISLLEELLPYIPGMQQHWELNPNQLPSNAPSDAVGMTRRITPQNTQQSLADDPLDWCLMQLQGKSDNENYFDHGMLFSMLQDHLSSNPSEGKRLDEVTYRALSDLSASHEMLVAVLSHTPRNRARHLHDVIAQEDRECWKTQQPFNIDGIVFERISKAFMKDFFRVNPPTGPKSPESISQSWALRVAVEKFWESIRAFLRKDLTRSGPGFTQDEVDSLLGVVSANLSAEYIEDEQRAQAEMFAAIHIADEPQSMTGTFNESPEPSPASTTIAQGREKVKTRGEQCSAAGDITEPLGEAVQNITKDAVISLTRESLGVIHLMFPSKDNVAKEVTWDRFVRVMIEAGFMARNNSGSAVAFKDPGNGGRIVFHKPHPADKIDPVLLRTMGKRMAKWFGWKRELFALRDGKTSGVQE